MASNTLLLPHSYPPASTRWPALLRAWLPVFLFAGIFTLESTAAFGSNRTSAPLHSLLHSFLGSAVDPNWPQIHHMIRKTGHFVGYGMLSLVLLRGFRHTLRNSAARLRSLWASPALAIAATFLVASADEIHQTFLPNRTGCFADVLLDTSGAAAMQLALILVLCTIRLWRKDELKEAEPRSQRSARLAA